MTPPNRRLLVTLLVCFACGCNEVGAVQAPVQPGEPAPATFSTDGGLTRNSLEEAAQAPRPKYSPRVSRRQQNRIVVRRRSARLAEQRVKPSSGTLRRRTSSGRRNLFVSFVYAWNGWVVHTFHTTKGTVMLKRIGFKG